MRAEARELSGHRRLRAFWYLLLAAAAVALLAWPAPPGAPGAAPKRLPAITFDDRAGGRLVVTARAYRLVLGKRDGRILDVIDRTSGARVVRGSTGCLWRAASHGGPSLVRGCSFTPRGAHRFSYRWNPASATLTLNYRDPLVGSALVTVRARAAFFDLRLTIENRGAVLTKVSFPEDLFGDVRTVEAGYAPNVLPGVRLKPGFFTRVGNNLEIYPSRWAFADYLGLDAGGGHMSL